MIIRKLTEQDIPSFVDLWNQDFELLTSSKFLMTTDKALAGFKQNMFDYYGLFDPDKLIGFILYQVINRNVWIKHVLVHKDHRKKGNGSFLLLKTLKKYEGKEIKTEVLFENSLAKKFFIDNSFKIIKKDILKKQLILSLFV